MAVKNLILGKSDYKFFINKRIFAGTIEYIYWNIQCIA
ncbi:hypothetical protein KIS4809_1422 [Bacillus sp. ZZV12-4809]|nr:hypothetical protein KIS4809_1422 [Bacillus sp. ZZV12-4809]